MFGTTHAKNFENGEILPLLETGENCPLVGSKNIRTTSAHFGPLPTTARKKSSNTALHDSCFSV